MSEMNAEQLVYRILKLIGEDPDRGGLQDTPTRVEKAWAHWFGGYKQDPKAILKQFEDGAEGTDGMVFQGNIPFYSHCEHHLAPFFGYAHIAYIPKGKIVGLSKLSRLVDVFAHRLSVQERMSNQIANALMTHLEPLGVGVTLQARHLCMESRGIRRTGTVTVTQALRGNFKEHAEVRAEFMGMVTATMQGVKTL